MRQSNKLSAKLIETAKPKNTAYNLRKRRLEQEAESEERDKALTFEVVDKEWFEKTNC